MRFQSNLKSALSLFIPFLSNGYLFFTCSALFILGSLAIRTNATQANEHFRPLTADAYNFLLQSQSYTPAKHQTLAKIKAGCEVAYLDSDRLVADFPVLRGLSRAQLEEWVVDQFCYMSTAQSALNDIRQTPLPFDLTQTKQGVRQMGWGRADAVPAHFDENFIGWVDVKGTGMADNSGKLIEQISKFQKIMQNSPSDTSPEAKLDQLRTKPYSDGLMTFGEAVAETTRQTAVQMTFDLLNAANHRNPDFEFPLETVETYFILSLPVDILKNNRTSTRAALYGRQAHFGRNSKGYPAPEDAYKSFQSSHQYTHGFSAVDFGAVWPTHPLLKKQFGPRHEHLAFDAQLNSLPWINGHEASRKFLEGDRFAIYTHLHEMLGNEFIQLWKENEKKKPALGYSPWIYHARGLAKALAEPLTREASRGKISDEAVTQFTELLKSPQFLNRRGEKILFETVIQPYSQRFIEHYVRNIHLVGESNDIPAESLSWVFMKAHAGNFTIFNQDVSIVFERFKIKEAAQLIFVRAWIKTVLKKLSLNTKSVHDNYYEAVYLYQLNGYIFDWIGKQVLRNVSFSKEFLLEMDGFLSEIAKQPENSILKSHFNALQLILNKTSETTATSPFKVTLCSDLLKGV